jgi:hypothetical protein
VRYGPLRRKKMNSSIETVQIKQKISFHQFKKETHHKKVKFIWTSKDGVKIKSFESDKFYCTPYKDQLSLPRFGMAKKQEWFKTGENTYKAVSEYGHTIFEVAAEI